MEEILEEAVQKITLGDYIQQNYATASSFNGIVDGYTALPPESRHRLPEGTGEFRRAESQYYQLKQGLAFQQE